MGDRIKLITKLNEIGEDFEKLAVGLRDRMPYLSYKVFRVSETCREAAQELKENGTARVELEGGGSTWWHVCEECRTTVAATDKFCRECGRRLIRT